MGIGDLISTLKVAGVTNWNFSINSDAQVLYAPDYPTDQKALIEAAVAKYDPLPGFKDQAKARIDAWAEALRNTVLTPGAGQMAAYQAKETQASAMLQDADPTEAKYPDIYNEVGITADTPHDVAMAVLAAAEKWRVFGRAVEKARLAGKKAVDAATDAAGVDAAEKAVVWPSTGQR